MSSFCGVAAVIVFLGDQCHLGLLLSLGVCLICKDIGCPNLQIIPFSLLVFIEAVKDQEGIF